MAAERDVYQTLTQEGLHTGMAYNEVPYGVLGGIAAHAAMHGEIDWRERSITLPSRCELPRVRENGTLRDIDLLVHSHREEDVIDGKRITEDVLEGKLSVSVFGLRHTSGARRPWDFVSHQSVDDQGKRWSQLDTIHTPLPTHWFESWLVRDACGRPVFATYSPIVIEAGYWMRSITGIRHKDAEKVEALHSRLFSMGQRDSVKRGPMSMADRTKYHEQRQTALAHYEAIATERHRIGWFALKAALLASAEKHPKLIAGAQGKFEQALATFVGRRR